MLIKFIPILSSLILVILLGISNQKENTKLKILIWNTPLLSLGTYIAISTGSGFLISYITTTNLARVNKSKFNNSIKYKAEQNINVPSELISNNDEIEIGKTLIERNIKDPLPTVNASFRVVGKFNRQNYRRQKKPFEQY